MACKLVTYDNLLALLTARCASAGTTLPETCDARGYWRTLFCADREANTFTPPKNKWDSLYCSYVSRANVTCRQGAWICPANCTCTANSARRIFTVLRDYYF